MICRLQKCLNRPRCIVIAHIVFIYVVLIELSKQVSVWQNAYQSSPTYHNIARCTTEHIIA